MNIARAWINCLRIYPIYLLLACGWVWISDSKSVETNAYQSETIIPEIVTQNEPDYFVGILKIDGRRHSLLVKDRVYELDVTELDELLDHIDYYQGHLVLVNGTLRVSTIHVTSLFDN